MAKIYEEIVGLVDAVETCRKTDNREWMHRHQQRLADLLSKLPSGSGIDAGTKLESATEHKIVFNVSFHHMDDNGSYDGWTEHKVIVTPTLSLGGINIKITGRDRNEIKDYLFELYHEALRAEG